MFSKNIAEGKIAKKRLRWRIARSGPWPRTDLPELPTTTDVAKVNVHIEPRLSLQTTLKSKMPCMLVATYSEYLHPKQTPCRRVKMMKPQTLIHKVRCTRTEGHLSSSRLGNQLEQSPTISCHSPVSAARFRKEPAWQGFEPNFQPHFLLPRGEA